METVLELSGTDVAFSELLATQPESLPSQAGDTAEMAPKIDFSACYARELSSLVWFVMNLGADPHRAADVAQSAFAEAFAGGTASSIPPPSLPACRTCLSATLRTRIAR